MEMATEFQGNSLLNWKRDEAVGVAPVGSIVCLKNH